MATADVTQAQFETELGACKTALAGGDYAEGRKQAAFARISWLNLPQSYTVSGRGKALHSSLDDLEKAIDMHERAAQGGGDVRMVPIGFGRVG
jgi:hypothetical protein